MRHHPVNGPAYFPNYPLCTPCKNAPAKNLQAQSTVTLANLTDGTSNTVAFSEWTKGEGIAAAQAKDGRGMVYRSPQSATAFAGQLDNDIQHAAACQASTAKNWTWKGDWWISGESATYSHTQTPNRKSCYYSDPGLNGTNYASAAANMRAASSMHPGGVNTAFFDGSVKFIKSTVNLTTWHALGTSNRGEVISAEAF